ncbi:GAF domain-containing protein [Spirosoma sp. KUDC1026]|uniref:GAF domain-containing protein n=1 Tax=Spirosoma sp. KUDC1026 TaxID=2745947 RepID=UPI00159B8EAB|nr:GAF domain-containing protein [Spirosoma sp. KUDC1026]QKZ14259.1 GAF domain-containing protein [Spirosoma sp. KUDC1026]
MPLIQVTDTDTRQDVLRSYTILDSLPEQDYDDITHLASAICQTSISLISLIDDDRQWFKSAHGLEIRETPTEYSFCTHTIQNPHEILIVPDSRQDSRFSGNPLVLGDPHVIFYAGVPLVNPQGFALGSLCVVDSRPKFGLTETQQAALKILAQQVVNMLEMRRSGSILQIQKRILEQRNNELDQLAGVIKADVKPKLHQVTASVNKLKAHIPVAPTTNALIDETLSTLREIEQRLQPFE